ncbi:hypothetical protein GCM10009672_22590 [Nesterenkonia lutea]
MDTNLDRDAEEDFVESLGLHVREYMRVPALVSEPQEIRFELDGTSYYRERGESFLDGTGELRHDFG